jgi:hypothetical protein
MSAESAEQYNTFYSIISRLYQKFKTMLRNRYSVRSTVNQMKTGLLSIFQTKKSGLETIALTLRIVSCFQIRLIS